MPISDVLAESTEADSNPVESTQRSVAKFFYERPILSKIAQLYWAIDKQDISNDAHIDNFLLITECEIYSNYIGDEFSWAEIREKTRGFIKQRKKDFPTRFEVLVPIRLGEYDLGTETFEIIDPDKIKERRRFLLSSKEFYDLVCGKKDDLEGYPKAMIVELGRPFSVDAVKATRSFARKFIEETNEQFRRVPLVRQNQGVLNDLREVYLFLNVKIFAYQDTNTRDIPGRPVATVMAVLESYDVYADRDKRQLMYSKDMRRRNKVSDLEKKLRQEYQEMVQKREEEARRRAAASAQDSNP